MKKKPQPPVKFEVGETVWCCDLNGRVFKGELVQAGPIAFRFDPDWRRHPSYRHYQLFKFDKELQARFAAQRSFEHQLIRVAEALGRNRHRIWLIQAEKA